ncbi:DUF6163 family protein [Nitratireductor basaltis]|uniref:Transmembrane protein n=1 Tax=Nitratireductor basaltis TaxID=472175 RepID=A0A084UBX4_9HYPH|nr:DUF6163 family protein [Nitratireductor basaltis]KFB10460.1 hypothetical protein EL18_01495 [Nitratireductor basaltis]
MTGEARGGMQFRPAAIDAVAELFMRSLALVSLALGIAYWVRLVGFYPGEAWRFDLMPFYWRVTAAPLAVLYPFAAVGLWALASWGPVIWFAAALMEAIMHLAFPELFGSRPILLVFHLAVLLGYVGLRLARHYSQRARAN